MILSKILCKKYIGINPQNMIFISNNQFFSQNNRFDFFVASCNDILCTLRYIKITFSESRYSSLKVDINENFIIFLIAIQFLFFSRS